MADFLNLRGQVIVITGGASGMGRAIAQAASREGARLVLADLCHKLAEGLLHGL